MDDGARGGQIEHPIRRHVDAGPTALVVPVKTLRLAKSRLHGHPRTALMRGFALDALTAALGSPAVAAVYVVTDERDLADEAVALGCRILADRGAGDLNRALRAAVADLSDEHIAVAAMLGDLPCLRPRELTAALTWADGRRAFVADTAGTGTTLLTVGDRSDFAPRFGVGSAHGHREAGYLPVPLPLDGLRRDVDTATDLQAALTLGAGAHTRAVMAEAS